MAGRRSVDSDHVIILQALLSICLRLSERSKELATFLRTSGPTSSRGPNPW